jgi:hypothetical protein
MCILSLGINGGGAEWSARVQKTVNSAPWPSKFQNIAVTKAATSSGDLKYISIHSIIESNDPYDACALVLGPSFESILIMVH